jgi:hypothetical protein
MDKTYQVRAKPSYCMTCKTLLKENLPLCFKQFFHMFVALLIAQKFLLKLRQALTIRLSVGETINIIAL